MTERLTDGQLRANLAFLHNGEPTTEELIDMHVRVVKLKEENIALRARVAKLEAALQDCRRYAEDYNDGSIPHLVVAALKDAP